MLWSSELRSTAGVGSGTNLSPPIATFNFCLLAISMLPSMRQGERPQLTQPHDRTLSALLALVVLQTKRTSPERLRRRSSFLLELEKHR